MAFTNPHDRPCIFPEGLLTGSQQTEQRYWGLSKNS